ncbi:hypothetical protein J5N97_012924 [Dioscorea zingiberensis]|uniref:Trichome birefringence-like N-terminal domain-containing protein n=1 Tax=Dioscorea zingiberensis TaxID=325984 RepID=A0A9D5CPZ1_9LILI|nr:hypothetical protein J5N97_012924 [Dioscorea zingiberensis]
MHLLRHISSVLSSESFTMMHCGSNSRKGPTTIISLQSSDDGDMPKKEKKTKEADEQEGIKLLELEVARPEKVVVKVPKSCDLFEGVWVLDNTTHPMYKKHECEFLTE